jgi:tetratricopeptide (TPR) repeat protein
MEIVMMHAVRMLALALAGVVVASQASAQTRDENWDQCVARSPNVSIMGCTALIDAKQEVGEELAKVYSNRALAYLDKRDYDRAIQDYDEAILLNPTSAAYYLDRGDAYYYKEQHAKAIQDFDRSIQLDPAAPDAWWLRCRSRAIVNILNDALSDCSEALRLRPTHWGAYTSRGLAYLKLKQFDQAIADYDAALKLFTQIPDALYGRGIAKRTKGDTAGGDADIKAARAFSPTIAADMAKQGVKP